MTSAKVVNRRSLLSTTVLPRTIKIHDWRLQFAQESYRRDDGQLEGKSKRDVRRSNKNWLVASWNTRAQLLTKGACKVRELDFFYGCAREERTGNKHKKGVHFPRAFFPLYAGFFKFYYQGSIYINFLKCYFGVMHGNHHFITRCCDCVTFRLLL